MNYDAFISYKQSECSELAEALESELVRFGRRAWEPKALNIFRDQSDLSAKPELWSELQSRLDRADNLIVLCSLEAVTSEWVNREIAYWFDTKTDPLNSLVLILASGDLSKDATSGMYIPGGAATGQSMPPELLSRLPRVEGRHQDLFYVDLRGFATEGEGGRLPRDSVGRVVAAVTNQRLDEVLRTYERRRNRRILMLTVSAIASALAAVLASVFYFQADRDRSRAEAATAEAIANSLEASSRTVETEQPELAIALALESMERSLETSTAQAESLGRAFLSREAVDLRPAYPPIDYARGLISDIEFHPTREEIAIVSDDSITAWDLAMREAVWTVEIANPPMGNFKYDPSGSMLIVGYLMVDSLTAGFLVIDADNGEVLSDISGLTGDLEDVFFLPNSSEVMIRYDDAGIMERRDAFTGELVTSFSSGGGFIGDLTYGSGIDVHPTSGLLAVGTYDGGVALWTTSGEPADYQLSIQASEVHDLAYSFSGDTMAIAGASSVDLWDLSEGTVVAALEGHRGFAIHVSASPYLPLFATTSSDGQTLLWDSSTGEQLATLASSEGIPIEPTFHPSEPLLANVDPAGFVQIWDLGGSTASSVSLQRNESVEVLTAAYSADAATLAAGSEDGSIDVWDLSTRSVIEQYCCHQGLVQAVDFRPNGEEIVSAGTSMVGDDAIRIWTRGNELSQVVSGLIANDVAFAPGGLRYVIGGPDGAKIYDWGSDTPLSGPHESQFWVRSVAYDPMDRYFATGRDDGVVEVWNATNFEKVTSLATGGASVEALNFHPTGAFLAGGSVDGLIMVWDVENGDVVHSFSSHPGEVTDLDYDPTGEILGSVGDDGAARLWSHNDGSPLIAFLAHEDAATSIAFASNGSSFATSSSDHTVKIWPVVTPEYLCGLLAAEVASEEVAVFLPAGEVPKACEYET